VLKQPLHRTNLRIEWEFSASDKPDCVMLEKRYSFVIQNNSALDQIYPFRFKQIAGKEIREETKFLCLKTQNQAGIHEFPLGQLHIQGLSKDLVVEAGKSLTIYYALQEISRMVRDDIY